MGYRSEPKTGCAPILLFAFVLFICFELDYCEDTKPHDDHIKSETQKLLATAHKEAVNSVDTLNLQGLFVDAESANKDSACLATEMLGWMKYQGENPRFCDYKQVYDTVDMGNGQTGFKLSKHMWYINVSKAMKDPCFAKTYNQYCKTIKQLEIARRQNKIK